jgi:methionine synthase II (cobalamin-independent)
MIGKDIQIEDLVKLYPKAVPFLMSKGIVCIQCGEPIWGTLEELALRKGITQIEYIVLELNEYLSQ